MAVKPGIRLFHQLQQEGVTRSEDEVSVGHKTACTAHDILLQVVSVGQGDGVQV